MPPARSSSDRPWHAAAPAPIVLISGPEQLLAGRAVERIGAALRRAGATVATTTLDAGTYTKGALIAAASPSLFDDPGLVVVEGAERMNDEFLADALAYAQSPDPDVTVVIRHGGGVRGKKLLDTLKKADVPIYSCPAIKKDSEVVEFAMGEFARASRPIAARAVRALVDAVGTDVAEVAAACRQLMNDVDGSLTEEHVTRYYGSRVNATGFAVADAAIAGKTGDALALVRHAVSTGTDPVPLVAAMAMKLRTLAKVGAARGRRLDPVKDLSMAPWQVDRAKKDLRMWDADRLASAIEAVAAADAEIKGASRAPHFALERAVRIVSELARG
ncbi:DNA polymerase III subunit delta [Demequina zhanjiangensis]|uniref:DNA-directed DNA polymerase n=1 Tax=Demequina zhanjiangensis TaxID=3051659 RepID=A0ABT8G016_9MICO|nr:DNA polymerase III subunit delta [Demequina sp. SYSU T00b26]MDN4472484.1 DNA polymerase III subunit delta [Demequina sp. SYSU T00b26]